MNTPDLTRTGFGQTLNRSEHISETISEQWETGYIQCYRLKNDIYFGEILQKPGFQNFDSGLNNYQSDSKPKNEVRKCEV